MQGNYRNHQYLSPQQQQQRQQRPPLQPPTVAQARAQVASTLASKTQNLTSSKYNNTSNRRLDNDSGLLQMPNISPPRPHLSQCQQQQQQHHPSRQLQMQTANGLAQAPEPAGAACYANQRPAANGGGGDCQQVPATWQAGQQQRRHPDLHHPSHLAHSQNQQQRLYSPQQFDFHRHQQAQYQQQEQQQWRHLQPEPAELEQRHRQRDQAVARPPSDYADQEEYALLLRQTKLSHQYPASSSKTAPPRPQQQQQQQQQQQLAAQKMHVNFNRSQRGAGKETDGDEQDNGEQRKKKYLTAKYGQQQMNLIKKRLKIEMWLYEQLQQLAKGSQSEAELDEIDIDLDQILDMEDDATRRRWLKKTLEPFEDVPKEQVDKFIEQVLEQSRLL